MPDSLTTQALAGTYLLTTARLVGVHQGSSEDEYNDLLAYAKSLEYSLYTFTPDGQCRYLRGGVLQQGSYVLKGTNLTFGATAFQQLTLTRQSISMLLTQETNDKQIELRCRAYRLGLSIDGLRFSALEAAAFTRPAQPETDVQIRERVKNSLYFYSLFFRTVYTNQFNRFKPAAISMPIRFYNGGVKVPYKFDSTASWTKTYATMRNAERAHEYFRRAAKAVKTYPTGENYIHEYSLVLAKMAATL